MICLFKKDIKKNIYILIIRFKPFSKNNEIEKQQNNFYYLDLYNKYASVGNNLGVYLYSYENYIILKFHSLLLNNSKY